MSIRKRHIIGIVTLLVVVVALALPLGVIAALQPSTERPVVASACSVNESGQVRSGADAASNTECIPGFVEVVATNGKEGYVSRTQLDAVTLYSASEEEAERVRAKHREKAAALFRDEVNRLLPAGQSISLDEAKTALHLVEANSRYLDPPAPQRLFFADADPRLAVLDEIDIDEWLKIWRRVDEGMTVTIPVYESDGQTVIGEFPISLL